jgi:hypothetical protein
MPALHQCMRVRPRGYFQGGMFSLKRDLLYDETTAVSLESADYTEK